MSRFSEGIKGGAKKLGITNVPSMLEANKKGFGEAVVNPIGAMNQGAAKVVMPAINPNSVVGKVVSGIANPKKALKTNLGSVEDQWKKLWGQLYPQIDTSTSIGKGSWSSGGVGQGPYDAATTQRFKDYADQLNARAQGKSESLAAAQAMAQQDRNVKQMAANYAAAPQTALGTRNVMNQQALAGQNIARDAATARLAEINAANQDYGNLLGKMGGDQAAMTQSREKIAADMAKAQADLEFQAKKARADAAGRLASGIMEGIGKGAVMASAM